MGTRGEAQGQNHIVNQLKAPDTEIGSPPVGTGSPPLGTGNPPVETGHPSVGAGNPPVGTRTPLVGTDSHIMRAEINQMTGTPDMSITVTGIGMQMGATMLPRVSG